MTWNELTSADQISDLIAHSSTVPCLIFKHSTTCSISFMAKSRLEANWDFEPGNPECYYVDVKSMRMISLAIAEKFQVHHESPQVLLIVNGECIYDASHLDITVDEIHEALQTQML
ncbi:MAG: bacillithiol system redox-active protein YtxJ [Saprospiraceae bacterium]